MNWKSRFRLPARRRTLLLVTVPVVAVLALLAWRAPAQIDAPDVGPLPRLFYNFVLASDGAAHAEAARQLGAQWQPGFTPMGLEVLRFAREPTAVRALIDLLEKSTGQAHGYDLHAWQAWWWNQPEQREPSYAAWKAALYALIDKRFEAYFDASPATTIRLDEVVWGGVGQDGIPPLRNPQMIAAEAASYLRDEHIVFGIEVAGEARAYPKRILAWHEMFTDTIAGQPLAGVYCTLCGTVILYRTEFAGVRHDIGTSGFLYRSNKLMYDRATSSLWNTFQGRPVVGSLVGKGIELERLSVVTTTWAEWKRRHPGTTVLSLDTGHQRDYGEGVAYAEYFATDELMFNVPALDTRLTNKAEILALLLPGHSDKPLAVAADFLSRNPVWQDQVGDTRFVVLTDPSGANRVYASGDVNFERFDGDVTATSSDGTAWRVSESELTAGDGRSLARLPYHRAFWFGWYSSFPQTRLVM